jgi:glycosyltransferase involved in cell wall biosynthesis
MSTHAQRTFLERGFSPERVVVVHPPMEVAAFPIAEFRGPIFRVSYVGRLEISKGFHHLVEAFDRARLPDAELVLWAGPGSRPVTNYLTARMQRNPAIRLRPVAVRDVGFAEVYGKSHVVVHPSPADGFGYSVAEAMACGVPVIVTSTTGAADWVEDGVNGFIVPPRDPEAIRERLQWCYDHPERLAALGRAGRETVERYDLNRFRSTYVPLVRCLAEAN